MFAAKSNQWCLFPDKQSQANFCPCTKRVVCEDCYGEGLYLISIDSFPEGCKEAPFP
jgi:hypothetical protein